MNDAEKKFRAVFGDRPVATFAQRRPANHEEARRWEKEGVIVNPPSIEAVVQEARRRHAEQAQTMAVEAAEDISLSVSSAGSNERRDG